MPNETGPLLDALTAGDAGALDALLPVVYDELKRIARRYLRRERPDHTLQATALVHEAYMKLVGRRQVSWQDRGQLMGLAAQAMRRILVSHARARNADRRGGGAPALTLTSAQPVAADPAFGVEDLDRALTALSELDPRQARIVELRYFAGLTVEETAEALALSPRTVKREWQFAKLWLHDAIERGVEPGS